MNAALQTQDPYPAATRAGRRTPLASVIGDLRGALVFELCTIVVNPILAAVVTGLTVTGSFAGRGVVLSMANPQSVPFAVMLLLGALVTIPFAVRTRRLIRLARTNDVASLKRLNPGGWAVIALLFSGLIQGILLLAASGRIRKLDTVDR